jgi:hypothetical protein
MMLGRCPVCHIQISLEAVCQDEAGRELLGILANLPGEASRALVQYLGLFRPEKRDLSNDRALRLAREVLALCADSLRLSAAMSETVEAIRAKSGAVPMKNHNYLKRVLEGMPAAMPVQAGGQLVDAPAVRMHEEAVRRSTPRAERRITAAEQAAMAIRNVSFGDDE